ncbi:MAG: LPXTG cell wall anchor domain-containing protein [Candidatus Saccharicenans sp.]|nr:LPXTG cell wall anchor domain-containing protein [Candidatus Saccharicenans sp.]MDI6848919.1 LPXTG cell wall anchor domain-containing protein [Candidatus Saccharicenans sp.]
MSKTILVLVALLLLVLLTTTISYAWSDDFGPWGKRDRGQGGRRGVAEPVAIALVGIGLAGLGIYALKNRKKN